MIISERERLFQAGYFDEQIAHANRAARERFRQHARKAVAQSVAPPAPKARTPSPQAAPQPAPKPLSAEQIAALAAERRRAAAQEARRKAIAEQRAAERRRAEIAESWERAHAAANGRPMPARKAAVAPVKAENHGWAAIHEAIRASRTAK